MIRYLINIIQNILLLSDSLFFLRGIYILFTRGIINKRRRSCIQVAGDQCTYMKLAMGLSVLSSMYFFERYKNASLIYNFWQVINAYLALLMWNQNKEDSNHIFVMPSYLAVLWELGRFDTWLYQKVNASFLMVKLITKC